MTEVWLRAALWLGLALAATLISIRLRVATALSEIAVGTVAQLLIGAVVGTALLGTTESWITFLSATGAVFLTFLAGAELDPAVLRTKWRETGVMGLVSFAAPFLGCAAYARYVLGWSSQASWLSGVALSTTSVAVVYAVMLELGLNSTGFGKAVLAACFVCDLGTVIALGLIFAPFTYRTLVFAVVTVVVIGVLPWVTPRFFRYEELFDGLRRQAQERHVTLETYVLVGHPADQILKAAARYGADMIVVGHRGRSAIRDWVSGSTSRRVFTHATCPVLVVRAR
jgi:Kef-type K+ transport system membrane component KefB